MRPFSFTRAAGAALLLVLPLSAQLQNAPSPRKVGARTAVPMDIQKLIGTLVFDLETATAKATADVWFLAGKVDGFPVFDLRQEIQRAQLDGEDLDPEKIQAHDFGRATGTMRILDVELQAGSRHHLRLEYAVGKPSVPTPLPAKFTEDGVRWDTWASDLRPGRYLEQWFPANLLFDQFAFELTLQVANAAGKVHEVVTNGDVESLGEEHWKITFPAHYTAFSPMVVLIPRNLVERSKRLVELKNGQKIHVDVCRPKDLKGRRVSPSVDAMHEAAAQALADFTEHMGPWPHGDRCTIFEYSGGRSMEYDGATTSSFGALRHELFHSYFGRGLKPASQNGGWWDEAYTVYFLGHLRAQSRPDRIRRGRSNRGGRRAGRSPLAPADPWNRVTPGASYSTGAWFFGEVAKVIGTAELNKAMSALCQKHTPHPITNAQLQAHLEGVAGDKAMQIQDLFDFVVYGRKPLVRFTTAQGAFDVELDLAAAPVTVKNFLRYVEGGFYDGGRFHRAVRPDNQTRADVPIAIVQGGINPGKRKAAFPPIALETTKKTRLEHGDGTISMARAAEPDSARSDFFICVGEQPALDFGGERNPDGQGFAAFGRVVAGMDVVRKIHAGKTNGESLLPAVPIRSVTRVRDR